MAGQSKKVFVGMSGGVDSSVSAALLRAQGFDVTGVFIKVWQPDWMECTWREDRLDAMRVAAVLGIPFLTLDLEAEYKREVVDYMIAEYKAGRTPNPDVMCNRHVKFGGFFDWAMAKGADFVATGHYARVQTAGDASNTPCLLAGRDQGKDQSYFLWQISGEKLAKVLFPVGDMEKSEVRRLAKKFGLPNAAKRDSQGICFIGDVSMREFLGHYIPSRRGDVLDEAGNIIGHHDGAVFLTLGERRGFSVTEKTASDAPYYVVSRDIKANTVTVAHSLALTAAEKTTFELAEINWIGRMPEAGAMRDTKASRKYCARTRHLGELLPCALPAVGRTSARVLFDAPLTISSGQSVVIYDGEECLGGGILV
jgi:tRNA-specific 2-thiouridylase